jgi:hypothetical protein
MLKKKPKRVLPPDYGGRRGHHDFSSPAHAYGNVNLKIKVGPFLS